MGQMVINCPGLRQRELYTPGHIKIRGHGAVRVCVEGHAIGGDIIDALDDVYFAGIRPVGFKSLPSSRPSSASLGHMTNIKTRRARNNVAVSREFTEI